MKIAQINTVYAVGSTGAIVKNLQRCAERSGDTVLCFHRYNDSGGSEAIPVSSWLDCHIHNRLSTITGLQGCFSILRTLSFLHKLRRFSPDLIHLHNIHGSYINHRLLFNFIKKHNIPTVWTLHDCWSFTGGCPHFVGYSCNKWEFGCFSCPHFMQNAGTYFDTSKLMWKKKKMWFTGVVNMTLVCPSIWLADLAKQSFLKQYSIQVINNGIDLDIFKPTKSDFRHKHNMENKKIILGVSSGWDERKGFDVFIELSKRLPDDYRIVLVGTDDKTDRQLPDGILSIHRTQNRQGLAEIYSAADVFVNPTREDNFPTVNMESIACGTPVLTFRTGGSPEMLDETCGSVVDCDDIDSLEKEIIRICTDKPYTKEACIKKARAFDKNERFKEYLKLYERVVVTRT